MIAAELAHEILAYVVAPLIALAGVLVPLLVKFGRMQAQNSSDHGQVRAAIEANTVAVQAVHGEVQAVGQRLEDHITGHQPQRGAA